MTLYYASSSTCVYYNIQMYVVRYDKRLLVHEVASLSGGGDLPLTILHV